jgi:hypothetical protein
MMPFTKKLRHTHHPLFYFSLGFTLGAAAIALYLGWIFERIAG